MVGPHHRPRARPAKSNLGFVVDPQPDDVSCGQACLQGIYRYHGDTVSLAELSAEVSTLDEGGTLGVFLGNHALRRGYRVTLFSYNLQVFDPTWFDLPADEIRARLREQAKFKTNARLRRATRGYDEFLQRGGKLRFRDLEPALIRRFLNRGLPVLTGLSATYLYQDKRDIPDTNREDDVRGEPVGHFVVLTGYDRETKEILVADPYPGNPLADSRYYAVGIHRLIGAIFLGITTYDANLLVIEPRGSRR